MIRPYKGRAINLAKPVQVYKNLHNGLFSIKQEGKVVAHASDITLRNVSFKVSKAGRNRVIRERKKNVHAFVIGIIESIGDSDTTGFKVSYNPYKTDYFYFKQDGQPAQLNKNQVLCMHNKEGLFMHNILDK